MPANLAPLLYRDLFLGLWAAWGLYWWASARNVKAAARSESPLSRWLHLGPPIVAGVLLGVPRSNLPWLDDRFMPFAAWEFWAGAAITAAALLFAVWARRHIGRNWSAIVTLKEGHELVTSGPYALVRHPIYTGLVFGFVGSAIALGQWRGIAAVLIVYLSLLRKYRLEERWMRERFGVAYEDYRRRVKALVPLLF
jgi:protein-S-isoprenylcysteine O-methyltransferase Ste14